MANYPPSTIARIGDINRGLLVETGSLAGATYLLTGGTQTEIFAIYGRLLVKYLWLEVLTDLSAHACQVAFTVTFTTPSIAVNAMCAKCASLASAARGLRSWFVGGAVATAAVITDSAGLSDINVNPHMVGGKDFIGTIGILASDASIASGTFMVGMCYVPMSNGAYAQALL